ncbi:unnamed protein product [Schistosoma curassoni]|uniref:Uncharacterized protein n=1 Tax=Schistosoma curassoni TaxID=6186 RepID=A0A183K5I9_9TREM|nr:unnamed protein product [Schistosoma curassoni]
MSTNPVKDRTFAFHEKAVSRTSLAETIYAWPCESISTGRVDTLYSRSYHGIWGPLLQRINNQIKIN